MVLSEDKKYIKRCFELAKRGMGKVSPNPMVGSVVVFEDSIIGEGWHQEYGGHHAEVNAINSVEDKKLLANSTIYVSLEPCAHFGKTPPCVDLILENKIPSVIIATKDPNPKVAGKSIAKLETAGVRVKVDILKDEALQLNQAFFTSFQKERPHIILKWAESKDAFFAPIKGQKWLSNAFTKRLTHKWRNHVDSILVGRKTVLDDNPQLTDRFWDGNNPIRIVIDPSLKISEQSKVLSDGHKSIVFNTEKTEINQNVEYIKIDKSPFPIIEILEHLHNRKITNLLVEGGAQTIQQFIEQNLWDEAYIYKTKTVLTKGIKSPKFVGENKMASEDISDNKLEIYYNK